MQVDMVERLSTHQISRKGLLICGCCSVAKLCRRLHHLNLAEVQRKRVRAQIRGGEREGAGDCGGEREMSFVLQIGSERGRNCRSSHSDYTFRSIEEPERGSEGEAGEP